MNEVRSRIEIAFYESELALTREFRFPTMSSNGHQEQRIDGKRKKRMASADTLTSDLPDPPGIRHAIERVDFLLGEMNVYVPIIS